MTRGDRSHPDRPRGARATGLHDTVTNTFGRRIVSGELAAGTVLTLESIQESAGVSLGVAREAARVLTSMGLTTARRRVGLTVQPRSSWNVFDPMLIRWRMDSGDQVEQLLSMSDLRRGIEPAAAALAAQRASPEDCSALSAAALDMIVFGREGDLEKYLQADIRFHRTILAATGNEMYRALGPIVAEVLAGRTHHGMMPADPNPLAIAMHEEVATAIRLGDSATAEATMRRIITEAADAVAHEFR
ncbi:FadR/GntR family transcriptional regulator [Williamsia sterculiae]|uniref:Transcriptional regulator, GntR family n=1 Tax=Williamsia sterculiae TaxID=1344003 RepID=A0A1N7H1I7_9NOCA|nr:FCD domain-containing protein [Williamsia sterculiae]SIS18717.1 transcriptional regulator, GntR family [Williamsia sterculiae]